MAREKSISGRAKDLLSYIAIATFVVASVVLFAAHQAKVGGSPYLPLKWLGFAAMTAIVFGYGIRNNRANWIDSRLWILLVIFAILHFSLGVTILLRTAVVGMIFYGVATGVEYLLLSMYLAYFLVLFRAGRSDPNRWPRSGRSQS